MEGAGMLRIVCVDDEPDDVELVRWALARAGRDAEVLHVDDEPGLLSGLETLPHLLCATTACPASRPNARSRSSRRARTRCRWWW
jgi:hypothetical protein